MPASEELDRAWNRVGWGGIEKGKRTMNKGKPKLAASLKSWKGGF